MKVSGKVYEKQGGGILKKKVSKYGGKNNFKSGMTSRVGHNRLTVPQMRAEYATFILLYLPAKTRGVMSITIDQ